MIQIGLGFFPTLQTVVLIKQMLMALLFGVGEFGVPSAFLHDSLGTENGILETVMTVEVVGFFDQVGIFNVPPSIAITDSWDVPGGVVDCASNQLTELYDSWHSSLLMFGNEKGDLSQ